MEPFTHPVLSLIADAAQSTRIFYAGGPEGYERMATVYSRWGTFDVLFGERDDVLVCCPDREALTSMARALKLEYAVARSGQDLIVQAPLLSARPAAPEAAPLEVAI